MAGVSDATEADECPCCHGDPDLVCDACGTHACWAGRFMCDEATTAGVVQREEYQRKEDSDA